MFVVMEDVLFEGDDTVCAEDLHAYSYAQLFGTLGETGVPFALILKALLNLADLSIGVPAGPFHLSMAKPDLPTVGIWLNHLPSWYDEPKPAARHLISRNLRERGFEQRPGSFFEQAGLDYAARWVDTRIVTGEQVWGAVEELLY